jgi:membrane-bound acyltransferase YfiQ involved in biofilm formation
MTRRLLLLNGIAAIMVVLNHSSSYGLSAMIFWANRYLPVSVPYFDFIGTLPYYILFMIHQLAEFAIPAFLFVSGFFVAFTSRIEKIPFGWRSVIPRIKKLILPFFFWSIVTMVMLQQFPPNIWRVITIYYYIPLIIQFYLLSPLLIPLAKKNWKLLLVATAFIQIGVEGLRLLSLMNIQFPGLQFILNITPVWFFPGRIFYFTIGIVASLNFEQFTRILPRLRWFLLGAVIFLLAFTVYEYEFLSRYLGIRWLVPQFAGISKALFASALVLCFLSFDKLKYPFSDKITNLGGKSLGIYLINTPALYFVGYLMYHLTPSLLGYPFVYQVILILSGMGIPLLLMSFTISTPARRVYHHVFG